MAACTKTSDWFRGREQLCSLLARQLPAFPWDGFATTCFWLAGWQICRLSLLLTGFLLSIYISRECIHSPGSQIECLPPLFCLVGWLFAAIPLVGQFEFPRCVTNSLAWWLSYFMEAIRGCVLLGCPCLILIILNVSVWYYPPVVFVARCSVRRALSVSLYPIQRVPLPSQCWLGPRLGRGCYHTAD